MSTKTYSHIKQNENHYLANTLMSQRIKLIIISGTSKNSDLFIVILEKLGCIHQQARTLTLVQLYDLRIKK